MARRYSKKEKDNAKRVAESIGIDPSNSLYNAAIEWIIETKDTENSIFENDDYADYLVSGQTKVGFNKFKTTKSYKKIIKEIKLFDSINQLTGSQSTQTPQPSQRPPQAPRRPPRPPSGTRPRQGQRVAQQTGNQKFIEEKLTTTLVYGEPKYNNIKLIFENDFDKVAYILRNRRTRSKKHDEYFNWARNVSGQTDDVIRAHGNKVLAQIKASIKNGNVQNDKLTVEATPLDFNPPNLRAQRTSPAVNVSTFLNRPTAAGPGEGLMNRSANAANVGRGESYETILDSLKNIQTSVDKILDLLKNQQVVATRLAERNRRIDEKRRREGKESLTEKSVKGLIKEAIKLFAPIQDILGRIINFIVYTLLGRAMVALIDWISDPANRNKVKSIARFLKDWWPVLLGTYVLFFTKFGQVIKGAIGLSFRLTKLMLTKLPELLKFAKSLGRGGKIGLAAAAIGTVAVGTGLYLKGKSDEEEHKKSEKPPTLPTQTKAYRSGGAITGPRQRNLNIRDIKTSGKITERSGVEITGAGLDTRLIAAQPGEYVISKAGVDAANKMYGEGFLEGLNKMAGASGIPQVVNNIQLASEGGPVGGKTKIRPEDYYSLLAISAAEDSTPQGRADVAQSIYNRLYAGGNPYNMNFNQNEGRNTIKDIINGSKQYEPTFKNTQDWMAIKDKKSAIKALAGYLASRAERAGSVQSADMKEAMKMINDTEKALKNSNLQRNAAKFVQGRLSFYGTSEREHMKGDDVIRMKKVGGKMVDARGNSFSHHLADDSKSPYATQRRTVAAPVPMGIAPPPPKPKPKSIGEQFINTVFGVFNQITNPSTIQTRPNIKTPSPRMRRETVSVLPPIDMPSQSRTRKYHSPVGTDVPSFSLYPPSIISDRGLIKDKLGMAA